jgi:hypothetical protein
MFRSFATLGLLFLALFITAPGQSIFHSGNVVSGDACNVLIESVKCKSSKEAAKHGCSLITYSQQLDKDAEGNECKNLYGLNNNDPQNPIQDTNPNNNCDKHQVNSIPCDAMQQHVSQGACVPEKDRCKTNPD